jgi:hypothetical protein
MDLLSISTGVVTPPVKVKDLLKTREKEVTYAERLLQKKLEKGIGFYDPIKRMMLKKSSSMKKVNVIKETAKEIVLKADNRVFVYMLLIAQN